MGSRKTKAAKAAERRQRDWERTDRRLRTARNVAALAGLVPLAIGLGCGTGAATFLCVVPYPWPLVGFDAAFGLVLGLTIRIALERRRFQRGAASDPRR